MVLAHPENEPLLAAMRARDHDAVGPAMLTAHLVLPATETEAGEFEGEAVRTEGGQVELVAFTSEANLRQWGPEAQQKVWMLGGDVVNLALRIGVSTLRVDPGQDHGGFFGREALVVLWRTVRGAGGAPMEPPGEWASGEIAEAVRGVVQARPDIDGAWLADRGGRPSVVMDTRVEDPTRLIQAMVDALKPLVKGLTIDFVLLDEGHRPEAEALGESLR